MSVNKFHLYSALEAEEIFGSKYFYRQRIYRLAESGKLITFNRKDTSCYLGDHILRAFINELEGRIKSSYPEISLASLSIFYDVVNGKRMVVDGLFGKGISIDTTKESEDDLIKKIGHIVEWFGSKPDEVLIDISTPQLEDQTKLLTIEDQTGNESISTFLPEEIVWIKIDNHLIDDVVVKSLILISLPSVAHFIGTKSDMFTEWLNQTSFSEFVLSAHPKKINAPDISGALKKGVINGYIPFVPFEILPEIIITFRQSNRKIIYPHKIQMLYDLAKTTLEAVGIAISGDKRHAAEELAKIGKGLGINVADQIIAIFKQYESRDYQIQTNKQFNSKVKQLGANYGAITGSLTLGITSRGVEHWKALGVSKKLPKKITSSSREVMRTLAPAEGVGMTFGEKHFIKSPNLDEAIDTGRQGKDFYQRLKDVGLLDD